MSDILLYLENPKCASIIYLIQLDGGDWIIGLGEWLWMNKTSYLELSLDHIGVIGA